MGLRWDPGFCSLLSFPGDSSNQSVLSIIATGCAVSQSKYLSVLRKKKKKTVVKTMHQGHRKVSKRSYFSESSEICLQGKTMHEYAIAKEKIDKSLL